jgi:hypothetical protein
LFCVEIDSAKLRKYQFIAANQKEYNESFSTEKHQFFFAESKISIYKKCIFAPLIVNGLMVKSPRHFGHVLVVKAIEKENLRL